MRMFKRLAACFLAVLIFSMMPVSTVLAAGTGTQTSGTTATQTVKTGLHKVNGKYYYYDKNGKIVAGTLKNGTYTCKRNGVLYYLTDKKVVEVYKKDDKYYYPNGKKMTKTQIYDFKTLLTARKLAAGITNDKMTKKEKLKACFKYVMYEYYYADVRTFKNTPGWPAVYANDHFKKGRGDCHSDAAAFAYMAKAIGYTNVYVCNDSKGSGHSWCEINGRVYDPLFCQSKYHGGWSKNYAAKYKSDGGTYKLSPVLHIAI